MMRWQEEDTWTSLQNDFNKPQQKKIKKKNPLKKISQKKISKKKISKKKSF